MVFSPRIAPRIAGLLFIVATVTGALSIYFSGSFSGKIPLSVIAQHQRQIKIGASLVITMQMAIAFIPIVLFSVLKRCDEALAVAYVVFRELEVFTYAITATGTFLLITLSQAYVGAGEPANSYFAVSELLLQRASAWVGVSGTVFFIASVLILNPMLYYWRLVPRAIALLGIVGAFPYLAATVLVAFGFISPTTSVPALLTIPLALQEMILAVWMIARGFNTETVRE